MLPKHSLATIMKIKGKEGSDTWRIQTFRIVVVLKFYSWYVFLYTIYVVYILLFLVDQ
jgi:hypothetical protein